MRYFTLLDFQHMVLAFFLGLLLVVFVYVGWWDKPKQKEDTEITDDLLFSHDESESYPIAPILYFIYAGAIIWAIGYAIIKGVAGGAIS